jgi:enolase
MWGLENHLHILVPDEELELREEDGKYRSQGLHMFLRSLNYNIEPELVSTLVFTDVQRSFFSVLLHPVM